MSGRAVDQDCLLLESENMVHFALMISVLILLTTSVNAEFECYDGDSEQDPTPRIVGNCKACVNVTSPNSGEDLFLF